MSNTAQNKDVGVIDGETYSPAELRSIAASPVPREKVVGLLKKVVMYVTRVRDGRRELLVFEHRDHPAAGWQVPAGTVETGEPAIDAARRELEEEAGLSNLPLLGRIDVYEWFNPETSRVHRRHVYHFDSAGNLPEAWNHVVRSDAEDNGMVFCYRWMPLHEAAATLTGNQGQSIRKLL